MVDRAGLLLTDCHRLTFTRSCEHRAFLLDNHLNTELWEESNNIGHESLSKKLQKINHRSKDSNNNLKIFYKNSKKSSDRFIQLNSVQRSERKHKTE